MAYNVSRMGPNLRAEYKQDPRIAQALRAQQQGTSMEPARTPMAAVARALQGTVGGYMQGQVRRDYMDRAEQQRAQRQEAAKSIAAQLTGYDPNAAAETQQAALQAGGGPTPEAAAMQEQLQAQQGGRQAQARQRYEQIADMLAQSPEMLQAGQASVLEVMTREPQKPEYKTVDGRIVQTGPSGVEDVTPWERQPEREQFTVNRGQNQVTYIGDPTDPETWQEVAQAPRSTGVTVNTGATQGKFAEEIGKKSAERWNEVLSGGDRAAQSEIMIDRMAGLLSSGEINTGALQPALTGLQAVGEDLGFDLDRVAQDIGVRLGDLSSKEEFERLSKALTMKALQGFKGNTSNKELQFAREQVARLGQSEGGNVRALAAMKALNQVARENAQRAAGIRSQDDWAKFERQRLNRGPERVEELTDQYEEQLRQRVQNTSSMSFGEDDRQPETPDNNDDGWKVERID